MTPAGFAPLVVVDFFGPLFAPVLAVARFLVVVVVDSVTVGKILGLELPNIFGSASSSRLRAQLLHKLATVIVNYIEY